MRLVVLLSGIIAGIVGLGFGWWGDPSGLVDIYDLPTPFFAAAVLAIHAASAVSIAGGLMVLAIPRVAGMMILASSMAWLIIVAMLGGGMSVSMAALIGIGVGGGLVAFLPSLNRAFYRLERAGTVVEEPRVLAEPRQTRDVPEEEPAAKPARPAAPDPQTDEWPGIVYEARAARFEPDEPFIDEIPRVREDDRVDPPGRGYQIHQGQIRPVTLKRRRRRGGQARAFAGLAALALLLIGLPSLLLIDYQMRSSADIAALRAGEAADNTPDAAEVAADVTEVGEAPASPPVVADPAPAAAQPVQQIAELPPVAPALPSLAVPDVPVQQPATPSPLAELPSASTVTAPTPMMPRPLAPELPVAAAAAPQVETPAPAPALPVPTVAAAYADPFQYCTSVREADVPQQSLIATTLPRELVDGVRQVTNMPDAEIFWRCMSSTVWVCAQPANGYACGRVPTPAEREAFCTDNPGAPNVLAPGGSWRCNGMQVVMAQAENPIDARGFDRTAWLALSRAPVEDGAPG